MSENRIVYSKWIKRGTNTFIPTDNSQILQKVDAGLYDLRTSNDIGFYMIKRELYLDEILEFPSQIHHEVISSIKHFWTRRDKFKEYGFAFKRGILLHGKAGCGKTCLINLCSKHVINELDGVVVSLNNDYELDIYSKAMPEIFRVIESDRPLVVIFEDIESLCTGGSTESLLLNVLDGLDQFENVIYLASTNYIEKLKERIMNRPSRFDRRVYVPFLSREDRIFYFERKLKKEDLMLIDINKWADDTHGMSVAHLAELIKSVIIFGNGYQESIDILKEMNEFKTLSSQSYEKENSTLGFATIKFGAPDTSKESRIIHKEST